MPVRMTKYSPYGRFFEIAFMRVVQAGALEITLKTVKDIWSRSARFQRGDSGKSTLSSFRAVFMVWFIRGIAFCVFYV